MFGDEAPAVEERDVRAEVTQLAMLQKPAAVPGQQQVMLPQTATPAELMMPIAGYLLVLSLAFRLAIPRQSPRQL